MQHPGDKRHRLPRITPLATAPITTPMRALGFALSLALGACAAPDKLPAAAPTPAPAAPSLEGSEWRLKELSGRAVLDGVAATLAFTAPGRVSGNGSCNRFMGSVSADTNLHMRLSQIATTRMACAGPVDEQERRYIAALEQVHHYEIQGQQLLLYMQGQQLPLRFERTRP